jgi:dTDP-4-amino-4,6-dideoxygalactose transaminase
VSDLLAVLGGPSVIRAEAHRRYPAVGARELEYIRLVLESGVLWGPSAPRVRQLESAWAERIGVRHCVAVDSGTAALHCAVLACGIVPGDEVIVPAYSFIATASPVLMAGATPVFVDVDATTAAIAPDRVREAVTARTRAIIVAHLHGLPGDVEPLQEIAAANGLALIEDCAQAHAARYRGRPVGAFGNVGTFSLNATKTLAGPEGGLLVTNSDDIYNRVAKIRVFGTEWRDGERIRRDADSLGYNYRTNELMAAFTLARLEVFDEENACRVANAHRLLRGLDGLAGLELPRIFPDRDHVFQMFRIRVGEAARMIGMPAGMLREKVVRALQAEGARWWIWERKPLPHYALFQAPHDGRKWDWRAHAIPNSEALASDAIFTYAHYPPNNGDLMDQYVEALRKVWNRLDVVATRVDA